MVRVSFLKFLYKSQVIQNKSIAKLLLIILTYLCHLTSSIVNISEGIITYKEESYMTHLMTHTHNLKTQGAGGLF